MSKKELKNETKKEEKVSKEKKVSTKLTKDKKVKKETKKNTKKVDKKPKEKKELFLTSVKKEMGKVRWPLKSEMIKYSGATLLFIIFFGLFFAFGDAIIAGLKMLVR